MWIRSKSVLLLACLLLWLSFLPVGHCIATTTTETVTMSAAQYNLLKMQVSELELRLQMLKENSQTDKKQLAESKEDLNNLKQELTNAQNSLTIANESYQTLNNSLQTLTSEIAQMENTNKRIERQRDTWAVLAVIAAAFAAR